jgi:hypothetical protein
MSRAYRITLKGSDEIRTRLELLDILPPEATAELLREELKSRGFAEHADGTLSRERGGVTVTVDPCSGEVSVTSEVAESVALEADHGDVMGHYVRSSLEPSSGFPARSRYDLLRSSPSFVKEDFAHLWSNVRDYAFKFERA